MGTRADFYIGRGEDAEWLGSIAWDGYPDGIKDWAVLTVTRPSAFRKVVAAQLAKREDGTTPEMGWPWPWDTSATTDYAYAYDKGKVWASGFGRPWFNPRKKEPENPRGPCPVFPNMADKKRVTMGARSGLLVVQAR